MIPASSVQNSSQVISGSARKRMPYCAAMDASMRGQSSYRSYQVLGFVLGREKSSLNNLEFFSECASKSGHKDYLKISEGDI